VIAEGSQGPVSYPEGGVEPIDFDSLIKLARCRRCGDWMESAGLKVHDEWCRQVPADERI